MNLFNRYQNLPHGLGAIVLSVMLALAACTSADNSANSSSGLTMGAAIAEMKREVEVVKKAPGAVFFYAYVRATAQA